MNTVRMTVAGFVVAMVVSGCAASATHITPSAPPASAARATDKQDDIQNNREKEMVLLFQSLLQMNKRDHLTITAKQAESLLPLIQRNSTEGELAAADQNVIKALLTAEQRQYVDSFLEETRSRKERFKELKEQKGISEEERERMIREFLAKRASERDGQLPPPRRNSEEGAASPSPGQGQGSQGGPGGKNIEQQLIELLQAKLKKDPTSK